MAAPCAAALWVASALRVPPVFTRIKATGLLGVGALPVTSSWAVPWALQQDPWLSCHPAPCWRAAFCTWRSWGGFAGSALYASSRGPGMGVGRFGDFVGGLPAAGEHVASFLYLQLLGSSAWAGQGWTPPWHSQP